MKITKKKVFGLLGLFLVVAITVFAALLPQTMASAALQQTDTITVRVVGDAPLVQFTSPPSGSRFTDPHQSFSFNYENVSKVTVEIEYTDENGEVHTYPFDTFEPAYDGAKDTYEAGSKTYQVDLSEQRFGYGDYKVTVWGDYRGVSKATSDVIEFHYGTTSGNITPGVNNGNGENGGGGTGPDDPFTGNLTVDPGVDPNDDRVGHLEVCVRDGNGNPVEGMCPMTIDPPFDPFILPFEDDGLPSGWYEVEIQPFDKKGNKMGDPEILKFYYQAKAVPVPDTGAPFANLNISRQDYLITGAIVFIAAAGLGIFIVVRKKASAKNNRR